MLAMNHHDYSKAPPTATKKVWGNPAREGKGNFIPAKKSERNMISEEETEAGDTEEEEG